MTIVAYIRQKNEKARTLYKFGQLDFDFSCVRAHFIKEKISRVP
jgi:hypothetical protein